MAEWHTLKTSLNTIINEVQWKRGLIMAFIGLSLSQFPNVSRADYAVQVGAFADKNNANRLIETLNLQGFPTSGILRHKNQETLTLVRVGPYKKRETAEQIRRRLEDKNIEGFLVGIPTPGKRVAPDSKQSSPATDYGDRSTAPPDKEPEPLSVENQFIEPDGKDDLGITQSDKEQDGTRTPVTQVDQPTYAINGFFQSELAYTYRSPTHLSKARNI